MRAFGKVVGRGNNNNNNNNNTTNEGLEHRRGSAAQQQQRALELANSSNFGYMDPSSSSLEQERRQKGTRVGTLLSVARKPSILSSSSRRTSSANSSANGSLNNSNHQHLPGGESGNHWSASTDGTYAAPPPPNNNSNGRTEEEDTFAARKSGRVNSKKFSADGDTWFENLAVVELPPHHRQTDTGGAATFVPPPPNEGEPPVNTLAIRSYFQSQSTGRRVWDEPPSGASHIRYATEEARRMAEIQMRDLKVEVTTRMVHPTDIDYYNDASSVDSNHSSRRTGRFRAMLRRKGSKSSNLNSSNHGNNGAGGEPIEKIKRKLTYRKNTPSAMGYYRNHDSYFDQQYQYPDAAAAASFEEDVQMAIVLSLAGTEDAAMVASQFQDTPIASPHQQQQQNHLIPHSDEEAIAMAKAMSLSEANGMIASNDSGNTKPSPAPAPAVQDPPYFAQSHPMSPRPQQQQQQLQPEPQQLQSPPRPQTQPTTQHQQHLQSPQPHPHLQHLQSPQSAASMVQGTPKSSEDTYLTEELMMAEVMERSRHEQQQHQYSRSNSEPYNTTASSTAAAVATMSSSFSSPYHPYNNNNHNTSDDSPYDEQSYHQSPSTSPLRRRGSRGAAAAAASTTTSLVKRVMGDSKRMTAAAMRNSKSPIRRINSQKSLGKEEQKARNMDDAANLAGLL